MKKQDDRQITADIESRLSALSDRFLQAGFRFDFRQWDDKESLSIVYCEKGEKRYSVCILSGEKPFLEVPEELFKELVDTVATLQQKYGEAFVDAVIKE